VPDPVEAASREFAAEIQRLSGQAEAVDRVWNVYRGGCQPEVRMGYDFGREWFALWDRAFASRSNDAACGELLQRVAAEGGPILMGLTAAASAARRSQVPVATIQGMVRWHGLEWWPLNAPAQQRAATR